MASKILSPLVDRLATMGKKDRHGKEGQHLGTEGHHFMKQWMLVKFCLI